MSEVLVVLGSALGAIGLFAIAFPGRLLGVVALITVTTPLRLFASAVRVLVGGVVLIASDSAPCPVAFRVVGIALIGTGAFALLVSNARLQSMVNWASQLDTRAVRVGGDAGQDLGWSARAGAG